MYIKIEKLDTYTDLRYEADLALADETRRGKALFYLNASDRKRSMLVYSLLGEGLKKEYGISPVPEILTGRYGKPFFPGHKDIHFSLSHCNSRCLCAIDGSPLGADVEDQIEDVELAEQVCSREEVSRIMSAKRPALAFAACWTAKESWLKLKGLGLTDLEAAKSIPSASDERVVFRTEVDEKEGFAWSVCSYRPG